MLSSVELHILRNGQPIPGSASDPKNKFKFAYGIVYFIAGLNLVLGFIALLFNIEFLQQMGIGLFSIGYGLVFLILGLFVQRKSIIALILAIAIFALDGITGIFLAAAQGNNPGSVGILMRIILLIPMIQGIGAIKALKAKED